MNENRRVKDNMIIQYFKDLGSMLKEHIRDYGMYVALLAIIVVFAIGTGGNFLSSRNISNLLNAFGYIAVMAVGMTLIIVIRHIDLSVGYVNGFVGAVAAILMVSAGLPVWLVVILALALGVVIGMWHGFLVAIMGIPAFVATLAGMFLFRGLLLQTLQSTGTLIIPNEAFIAISNGYIPDIMNIDGYHVLTLIIGALVIIGFIVFEFKNRQTKLKYNFKVSVPSIFVTKLLFMSVLIGLIAYILATYRGISWTVVIVVIVVTIYSIMMNKTTIGRYIYAVGGNPEAAELSGISVKKITMFVFGSMSMLAALSGLMFASRLRSATVTAGLGFELDAIAAAFVGGASATGGVGKVTGSIVGAIVMASLSNGMNMMGVAESIQYIVKGLVLVVAVIFDVRTRNKK
ncbi:MAG: sugar ABC transporter permease [Acholeplasmataceae bacterium]